MDVLTYILASEWTRVAAFVAGFGLSVLVFGAFSRVVLR